MESDRQRRGKFIPGQGNLLSPCGLGKFPCPAQESWKDIKEYNMFFAYARTAGPVESRVMKSQKSCLFGSNFVFWCSQLPRSLRFFFSLFSLVARRAGKEICKNQDCLAEECIIENARRDLSENLPALMRDCETIQT